MGLYEAIEAFDSATLAKTLSCVQCVAKTGATVNEIIYSGADASETVQLTYKDAISESCWEVAIEAGVVDFRRWELVLCVSYCDLERLRGVCDGHPQEVYVCWAGGCVFQSKEAGVDGTVGWVFAIKSDLFTEVTVVDTEDVVNVTEGAGKFPSLIGILDRKAIDCAGFVGEAG
jgi:hypothetical protein